jgi:hypothetical protein
LIAVSIEQARLDKDLIYKELVRYLLKEPGIADAFLLDALNVSTLPEPVKTAAQNGYYPSRSGDIQLVLMPQWIEGFMQKGTTHGVWNPYDSHIPLLWFGWNIPKGKTNSSTFMTDIAPTLASMLHIQMPNGSVGKVIKGFKQVTRALECQLFCMGLGLEDTARCFLYALYINKSLLDRSFLMYPVFALSPAWSQWSR